MTFPPLKSMYLLRGTLTALATWWLAALIALWLCFNPGTRFSPEALTIAGAWALSGLLFAPIGGYLYACIKQREVAVAAFITDNSLPTHERDTLRAIRAASPWAANLPTETLRSAYTHWEESHYSVGLTADAARIRAFLAYAFTRPIDRY